MLSSSYAKYLSRLKCELMKCELGNQMNKNLDRNFCYKDYCQQGETLKFMFSKKAQSYIYQVLQTIQMKLILLCVWAESAVLGSAKTALKFIYKV